MVNMFYCLIITLFLEIPAVATFTAQSPQGTPLRSPLGPIHIVIATGLPDVFITSTAHAASSECSKNCSSKMQIKIGETAE